MERDILHAFSQVKRRLIRLVGHTFHHTPMIMHVFLMSIQNLHEIYVVDV